MAAIELPVFPVIDENDRDALMNLRSLVIGQLVAIEEILREKHGSKVCTI